MVQIFLFFTMSFSMGVAIATCCHVRVLEANAIWDARDYAQSGRQNHALNVQRDKFAHLSVALVERVGMAEALNDIERAVKVANIFEYGRDLRTESHTQVQTSKEKDFLQVSSAGGKISMPWMMLIALCSALASSGMLMSWCRQREKRKQAQTRAQMLAMEVNALYNQAPCGYHSIDVESHLILQMNDTELAWLGYRREEVVGKMRQTDLMMPLSAKCYELEIWPCFLREQAISDVNVDYRRADGSDFSVRMNISTAVHHASGRLISRNVVYDISERREAEQEIARLNINLKYHAQHLSNLNKELESFSYSVSHDLRAPLRAISGYAMMIEEDYREILDVKGQELLQVIGKNVKKMDTLINDLLKLSKSTSVELRLAHFSMQELVEQNIAVLRHEHDKVEFIIETLGEVVANQSLIAQVWENLLGNAVKFSAKVPHPVVRVSAQVTPEEVIYQVHDNGIGFDMRYVHKLFGTFQRLHRQDDFAGTGIGLALVQRIVVRHGGRVWAESIAGEGSRFYFALPKTPLL